MSITEYRAPTQDDLPPHTESTNIEYRWPTQHDLPHTDDTPVDNEDQLKQYPLLIEPVLVHWSERSDYFIACNMGLYYALPNKLVVPDTFLVLGVPKERENSGRKSYVVWDEDNILPSLVIEIISNKIGKERPGEEKFILYEQRLRIPYYATFDLLSNEFIAYELRAGNYVQISTELAFFSSVGLGLTTWQGMYQGRDRLWLRWCDTDGKVLPTQAEKERLRAEKLAERLRSLGVDIDDLS